MMADAKDPLEFFERGVGVPLDVGLEFLRVEFAPMAPTGLRGERLGLGSSQIAIVGAPPQGEAADGLGLGTTALDEFDHPFPQVQGIGFQADKPNRLCANVNIKFYIIEVMALRRTRLHL
jgi:hypothetical protein